MCLRLSKALGFSCGDFHRGSMHCCPETQTRKLLASVNCAFPSSSAGEHERGELLSQSCHVVQRIERDGHSVSMGTTRSQPIAKAPGLFANRMLVSHRASRLHISPQLRIAKIGRVLFDACALLRGYDWQRPSKLRSRCERRAACITAPLKRWTSHLPDARFDDQINASLTSNSDI